MTTPCPQCVIKAGGALVQLRHHLEKADALFDNVFAALEETKPEMKAAGMKGMTYGVAMAHLRDAQRSAGLVMAAHEHLANAVIALGIETPTDEQLVTVGVQLNFR